MLIFDDHQTGFFMHTLKIFISLILMLLPVLAKLQAVSPEEYRSCFNTISRLHFDEAKSYLETNKEAPLLDAYRYHLRDYRAFLKIFLDENRNDFDEALEKRDEYLDFWEGLPDSFPGKEYFIGDSYLRWSMLRMKFNQKIRAGWELNKAYRNLSASVEKHPDYYPAVADLGIMEVFIGTVPDRYQWVMNLLNFEGTIPQGKEKIYKVLQVSRENDQWAYLEKPTLFMLSFVEMNTSEKVDDKLMNRLFAMDKAGEVAQEPLIIFLYADLLQKEYQNERALEILNYYNPEKDEVKFHYLYYMKGLSQLYRFDRECLKSFDLFTDNFSGLHFLKSAYQKKAWFYLLHQDSVRYFNEMQYVLEEGAAMTGADKQALKEAEGGNVPHADLLRARLLFDGGYFKDALKVLNESILPLENLSERTEFDYRKGRVLHMLGQYEEAINNYLRAYASGQELEDYFAANAMLMTGRIYLKLQETEKAESAFERCLDLSGFDYQYSIHQKARAGLAEAENTKKGTRH